MPLTYQGLQNLAEGNPANAEPNRYLGFTIDEIEKRSGRPLGMPAQEGEDIKEAAKKIMELYFGDANDRTDAAIMLRELTNSLPEDQRWIVGEHISNLFTDRVESSATSGVNEDKLGLIKKHLRTGAGLAALKAGAGIAQVVDGALKLSNLESPKFPERYQKNENLQEEIRKTQVRADQGDDKLEQMFNDMLAEDQAVTDDRSRSSGSIGQYTANIQAGASRRNKAKRKFADDAYKRKARERTRLDRLMSQDIREDLAIKDKEWREYFYKNRNDLMSRGRLSNQINSGLDNLFIGLNEGAQILPYLSEGDPSVISDAMEVHDEDSQTEFDSEAYNPYPSRTPYPSRSMRPISQDEFNSLGSRSTRDPALMTRYQLNLIRQGYPIQDEFGQWGHRTEEAHRRGVGSPMGEGWDADGLVRPNY